ncbi:MAG TPA: glycosyltransferase family 39 protein [Anaerolineae bacterium]|nr:glycosyltransferase family 39 protein [Anaerolineae bacterium]HNU02600.1 glycosyltransferase family 39 protein [Anaerolineae bacterium]
MTAPARRPRGSTHTVLLWLIVLLAAALRFFRIGYQSLWADEGNSAAMAGRSLAEISARAAADIHPPGYYWLLNLWTRIFGDSEAALRSLSALWGILLVWLVYQIVSRLFDRRTALIAAFFAAINPFLIFYSQEARMYSQLAALAALLFYGLVRYIMHENAVLPADGSGKRISFSGLATGIILFASIAGLYTHYTFPVMIGVATLLYLMWVANSRRRGFVNIRLLHWGLLLLVLAFFYLPWIGTAWNQLTSWPRSGQTAPLGDALTQVLAVLALGPVSPIEADSAWLAVFLALFILGLWPWVRANGRRAHWLSWGLSLLWLAAPAALVLLGGLYKPAYLKFLLVAAAPFTMLLGRGVTGFMEALSRGQWKRQPSAAKRTSRRGRSGAAAQPAAAPPAASPIGRVLAGLWLAAALLLVSIPTGITLAAYYFDPAAARDDYRAAVAYISAVAGPDDAIILNAPGQQEVFDYYYQGELPVYGLPEQRPPDQTATLARLDEIAQKHPHLYTLYWATEESDPGNLVESWLDTHAYKAEDRWQGNMRFVIYATQQPTDTWPTHASDALLGEQIRLNGYALSSQEVTSGDVLQLQLNWQAERQPDADYTVFVQLLDPRDQVVAQRDAPPGDSPTSQWQPGVEVIDRHGVLVPHGAAPGDYRLILGMYDPATGERLRIGEQDYVDLGVIRVNRPETPLPVEALRMQNGQSFTFSEITLLGHDRYKRGYSFNPAEPLHPNDLLHLTWYWRADVQPTAPWWFTARLVSGADTEVASVSGPLVSELYPTPNWQAGEVVRGEHDLQIPDYVKPGRYQLQLFLHTGNPADGVDRVNLGWVTVSE